MIFQFIGPEDSRKEAYAAFVRNHDNCHFLQDPAWAGVKDNWRWVGIMAIHENAELQGVLSVLLRPLPMGLHLAYAPRGPVCCREDPLVMKTLMDGMQTLAKQRRCLLTCMDPDEPEDREGFRKLMKELGFKERQSDAFGGVQPQSVFRLTLENREEAELLAAFSQKTRYNIRLAQRRGVRIRSYGAKSPDLQEALQEFGNLMKVTGQRDHFVVREESYFKKLLTSLGKDAALYLAWLEDQPIAGAMAIFYGDKAWYLYGASANAHRGTMPNYLLQWTMICEALQRNCRLYDFRGVPGTESPQDPLYGLYRFKKGFSGERIRFTGLFVCYHRKIAGRALDASQSLFRLLRRKYRTIKEKNS